MISSPDDSYSARREGMLHHEERSLKSLFDV